jgi:hypothetical protein
MIEEFRQVSLSLFQALPLIDVGVLRNVNFVKPKLLVVQESATDYTKDVKTCAKL